MERELCALSQRGESFGSANLSMAAHSISSASLTHPPTGRRPTMPLSSKEIMAQFDGHFNNPDSAATNSGASLDQIYATMTTQYLEIEFFLASLKSTAINGLHSATSATAVTPSTTQEQAKKHIQKLDAAVRNNWHCGAFCSTHGWGVNDNHTIVNCQSQKPGHVATSTHAADDGPGKTLNKGWDNFLSRRYADCT